MLDPAEGPSFGMLKVIMAIYNQEISSGRLTKDEADAVLFSMGYTLLCATTQNKTPKENAELAEEIFELGQQMGITIENLNIVVQDAESPKAFSS
jgi:anthranilate phosphoribosyltransferase